MTRIVAIDYEISSTCQARCPVCVRQDGGKLKDFVQTQRTLDETKHILNGVASGLKFVKLCGNWGDPMGCDEIADICEWFISESPKVRIDILDEPGMLAAITTSIGRCGGNIVEIYHQRLFYDVPAKLAKIDAVIETRGPDHVDEIIASLQAAKFQVRQMEDSAS